MSWLIDSGNRSFSSKGAGWLFYLLKDKYNGAISLSKRFRSYCHFKFIRFRWMSNELMDKNRNLLMDGIELLEKNHRPFIINVIGYGKYSPMENCHIRRNGVQIVRVGGIRISDSASSCIHMFLCDPFSISFRNTSHVHLVSFGFSISYRFT